MDLKLKTADEIKSQVILKSDSGRIVSPGTSEYNYSMSDYRRENLIISQRNDGLFSVSDSNTRFVWLMTKEELIKL